MKTPKIILSLILISALVGGLLAFKARESQRFVTYYFTISTTAWSNPNNWVAVPFLDCPSPKERLCGLVIFNPALIYPNGKPKVDQNPLNVNIAFAIAQTVEIFHADFQILLKPL